MSVTGLTKLVRAARFGERKDSIDYRAQFSRIDSLRYLRQFLAVRASASHNSSETASLSFLGRRWLDKRNQNSAFVQHLPRTFLRVASDRIKDNVDVADDSFKALPGVIDQFIGAELVK